MGYYYSKINPILFLFKCTVYLNSNVNICAKKKETGYKYINIHKNIHNIGTTLDAMIGAVRRKNNNLVPARPHTCTIPPLNSFIKFSFLCF